MAHNRAVRGEIDGLIATPNPGALEIQRPSGSDALQQTEQGMANPTSRPSQSLLRQAFAQQLTATLRFIIAARELDDLALKFNKTSIGFQFIGMRHRLPLVLSILHNLPHFQKLC
jgi:hypothetical protein